MGEEVRHDALQSSNHQVVSALRSLGISRLNFHRNDQRWPVPKTEVCAILAFQMERDRFLQVLDRLVNRGSLRHYRDFQTLSQKTGPVSRPNQCLYCLLQLLHVASSDSPNDTP